MPRSIEELQRLLQSQQSRRALLKYAMSGLAGLGFGSQTIQTLSAQVPNVVGPPTNLHDNRMPRLFCVAYINPDVPGQANQESMIARYPLTIVPQDMRITHVKWRDRIKHLNASIVMLGYLNVITETSVPGPGHVVMRKVKNAWCMYPGGSIPTLRMARNVRLFDPRKVQWQDAFLEACRTTLESYRYFDGLFLDNCTVFEIAHPIPEVKAEMRQALQTTLLRLRQTFPDAILIGNSSYNWQGLNGEMNEGRSHKILDEVDSFTGHASPSMDLYVSILKNSNDRAKVKREMALAHSQGACYSACVDYQHVLWFDAFDEVMVT